MTTMPESCLTWNLYIDARKRYAQTGDSADLAEADRLYRLHHQQVLAECRTTSREAGGEP